MFIRGQTSEGWPVENQQYKIFFTGIGRDTYNQCIDYILCHFKDPFAAERLNIDIRKILDFLEFSPNACPVCENPRLRKRKIRKVHLKRHSYKLYYRVVGNKVYIDALIHDRQDIEKLFK